MNKGKRIGCLLVLLGYLCSFMLSAQGMHSELDLFRVKRQLQTGDSLIVKGYEQLKEEADKALKASSHALVDFSVPGRYIDSAAHVRNSLGGENL